MEHSYDEWAANANEAVEISLVQPAPTGLRSIASFHPKFTYSIFGDEETIFGYQDLKISLRYHASDMRPNLHVSSSKKLKVVGEKNEPVDIPAVLKEFLPPVAFQKPSEFEDAVKQTAATGYTPPGERIKAFHSSDGRYEIWKGLLSDPAVKQLVSRVQIMVPFFIEGGTFIGTDDDAGAASESADRWTVFFLYRTRQSPGSADRYEHEFAGYSTVYRFLLPLGAATPPRAVGDDNAKKGGVAETELVLPSGDSGEPAFSLATLPCRSRISQFVILPPFQGKGNAGRLYSTIYEAYLGEPQTMEITVEDPNEAFDDVRDIADLTYLSRQPAFVERVRINTAVRIPRKGPSPNNIVDAAALDTLRHAVKIAPRQFNRVVEMYLMQKLAPAVRPTLEGEGEEEEEEEEEEEKDKGKGKAPATTPPTATKEQQHEYRLWRMFVKQRLYRHNKEILGQLDQAQRIEKLEETLRSVELEYARILSMFESRTRLASAEDAQSTAAKRKLTAEAATDVAQASGKKARIDG